MARLKPGMFADIEIVTTVQENVLLISDSALQTDGDNQIVFVALDDNKFEKRVVKTEWSNTAGWKLSTE